MAPPYHYDAVVVGSGPNGLSAAITLAQEGWKVAVLEAKETWGGGMRTAEITLPGFQHDICSTTHSMAIGSLFFRNISLEKFGLKWIHSPIPVAHPLDVGQAVTLERDFRTTAQNLGPDGPAYLRMMGFLVQNWQNLLDEFFGPLPLPPKHPLLAARAAVYFLQSANGLAQRLFKTEPARALLGGLAGHAILPLTKIATAAPGLILGMMAHTCGWPIAEGGSQKLADAMVALLKNLGGEVYTQTPVRNLADIPPARAILFDVTPQQLINITGDSMPPGYRHQLARYRYGSGVFKIDYALSEPVPWLAEACHKANTIHVGGTLDEIAVSEAQMWRGEHPDRPYVLFVQSSLFDPTRAPAGKHTGWAYCHVPNGSTIDMTTQIENQIERFAPGFRDTILARVTTNTKQMEAYNPNYIGGDIIGGTQDLLQQFARPVPSLNPYKTPIKGMYLCSSSTPPGGGVHGISGYQAAQRVLSDQQTIG
jgi:phytoene dehydrogenase-like protein